MPRDDVVLVQRRRLQPIMDPQGNLAVPPNYKLGMNPPCINLERFDVESKVNACVQVGLAEPGEKPELQQLAGHGPKGNEVDVFMDGVVGLPLDAVCTRLIVFYTDNVDPATGQPCNPLHAPRTFMRKPDHVAYQDLASSNIEPEFQVKLSLSVGDLTHVIVIVEYISPRQEAPIVFGHACLPVHKRFFAGNFLARLKLGDPRRSQERDVQDVRPPDRIAQEQKAALEKYDQAELEASVDAQALRNLLPAPPRKRAECVPMGYLIWRLDSSDMDKPFSELPSQLPLSQAELAIFAARQKHEDATPQSKGITTPKAADDAFVGNGIPLADNVSYIVPYAKERGAFVKVEGVRGMGDDQAMYIVVAHLRDAPEGKNRFFTVMPDWMSDIGAPQFKDPPFIFAGMPYNPLSTLILVLLKVNQLAAAPAPAAAAAAAGGAPGAPPPPPPSSPPPVVQPIAWSLNKMFLDDANIIRQGRFALPWLRGTPPPSLLAALGKEKLEKIYLSHLKQKTIQFLEPAATVTIAQGDPTCVPQLVDETAGRPQLRQLLVPGPQKKDFPTCTNEGMVGCTLRRAHETCFGGGDPRALLQRVTGAVQAFLQNSMKEL